MVKAQDVASAMSYAVSKQWPVLDAYPELGTQDRGMISKAIREARRQWYLETSTDNHAPDLLVPEGAPPVLRDIMMTRKDHGKGVLESLLEGLTFRDRFDKYMLYLDGLKPVKAPEKKQYALRSQNARTRSRTRYRPINLKRS